MDRIHQIRSVIFERQEEERDVAVTITEASTRAVMSHIAGAAGWAAGMRAAQGWSIRPKPPELPQMSDVVGGLGHEGGLEFDWSEIEAMAAEIRAKDAA